MWLRYDTRCYFNVRSKADISQLNLPQASAWVRTTLNSLQCRPGCRPWQRSCQTQLNSFRRSPTLHTDTRTHTQRMGSADNVHVKRRRLIRSALGRRCMLHNAAPSVCCVLAFRRRLVRWAGHTAGPGPGRPGRTGRDRAGRDDATAPVRTLACIDRCGAMAIALTGALSPINNTSRPR